MKAEWRQWADHDAQAPTHGSSPAPNVYGGAGRGISLAKLDSTGESTWNPPRPEFQNKTIKIKALENFVLCGLDSAAESSWRNPPAPEASHGKPPIVKAMNPDDHPWQSYATTIQPWLLVGTERRFCRSETVPLTSKIVGPVGTEHLLDPSHGLVFDTIYNKLNSLAVACMA